MRIEQSQLIKEIFPLKVIWKHEPLEGHDYHLEGFLHDSPDCGMVNKDPHKNHVCFYAH